jgi:hypothetical protein
MENPDRIGIEDLPMIQELYENRFSEEVVVVVLVAGLVDMLTTRPINKEIPQIL